MLSLLKKNVGPTTKNISVRDACFRGGDSTTRSERGGKVRNNILFDAWREKESGVVPWAEHEYPGHIGIH